MRTALLVVVTLAAVALVLGAVLNAAAPASGEIPPRVPGPGPADGRVLGVAVTAAEGEDFPAALGVARSAGMQVLGLPLKWSDVEVAPGRFDPEPDFLAVAAAAYPAVGVGVALELNPIDTAAVCVPADLAGRPWDDPEVVARLTAAAEWVLGRVGDLRVASLALGNEVDAALGTPEEVAAYGRMVKAVAARVAELRPDIPVGVKTTFAGLTGPRSGEFAALHGAGTVSLVTYYPLDDAFRVRPPSAVAGDFAAMLRVLPPGPVQVVEIGYPAGAACGSSPQAQAEFVNSAMAAWDTHRDRVRLLMFTWLSDLPAGTVDELVGYYGVSDPAFRAYLGTLGLRTADGRPRPAYDALRRAAAERGW